MTQEKKAADPSHLETRTPDVAAVRGTPGRGAVASMLTSAGIGVHGATGSFRPDQVLELQRSVGNRAVATLMAARLPSLQRAPGDKAPDPFTKPTEAPGLLKRGGLAIKSFFTTTFGKDPSKIKPDMPDVDETTRKQMYAIMAAAIADRDARKKRLMEQSFLPEEVAELQANREAFKDIPESWRPRVVTAAEWQVKKNKTALLEERVRATAGSAVRQEFATKADPAVLKNDREHAFKASLMDKSPAEAERLKKQHGLELEARQAQKKDSRAAQEAFDKEQEKQFEKSLKAMPKDKQAAAKAVFEASRKRRDAQRKLTQFKERMKGLPQDEIERRTKVYAEANGLGAALDLSTYDTAGSAIGGIGGITSAGSAPASGSGEIAKLAGNKAISGVSSDVGGREVQTKIGSATQGGDVISSAGSILSTANTVVGLIKSIKSKMDGDPAQQVAADDGIVDGVLGIGQSSETLGGQGVSLAKDFGGSSVNGVALQGVGIPIFDLAANFLQLVRDARRVVDNAQRAATSGKLGDHAKLLKDEVLGHVVGHVRQRGIQLACHYSIDALAAGLKIAGDVVTLTGVGAAAGQGVKLAGTAVAGVNTAARTVADSYLAGKALAARGEAQLALPGSADKLLEDDPLQVAQTIVLRSRGGDPQALRALSSFGVSEAVLEQSSDANVRAVILARLESSDSPQTITGKVAALLGKIGGAVKSVAGGVRDVFLKPFEIHELRKTKNALSYGGRSDRGVGWGIKQFFSGPGRVDAQKAHIKKVVESSALEPQTKARLLAMSLNRSQKLEKAKDDSRHEAVGEISRPKPSDLSTLSASQLEAYLERDDLDADERMEAAMQFFEKRQDELGAQRQLAPSN